MRKLCWIIQVGLNPMKISFLEKGRGIFEIDTEGKVMGQTEIRVMWLQA